MKKLLALLALSLAPALVACNTVRGVGQDVQSAGEGLQRASEEVQEELQD